MKSGFINCISIIIVFALIVGCQKKQDAETTKVSDADKQKLVKDLKDGFTGETTASAKYGEYSIKAKEDGLDNIAKLFEAASKSESIHARNHKTVLEKIGDKSPDVKPEFTVKTTKENLEDAVKGETYEVTTMYPEFKKLSDALGDYGLEASKSFDYALRTEAKHKVYYEESLKSLEAKTLDNLASVYWVCPICGNTVNNDKDILKCSICKNETEKWFKIE
jgi:rubrerythrin